MGLITAKQSGGKRRPIQSDGPEDEGATASRRRRWMVADLYSGVKDLQLMDTGNEGFTRFIPQKKLVGGPPDMWPEDNSSAIGKPIIPRGLASRSTSRPTGRSSSAYEN